MTCPRYLIDTNVFLRFLRSDHAKHSPASKALFDNAAVGTCVLILDALIIAESVWVLSSFYKTDRSRIAEALTEIMGKQGVMCPDQDVLTDAMDRFAKTKVDFIDCYLAARAAASEQMVVTFDNDFKTFSDITAIAPQSAVRNAQ